MDDFKSKNDKNCEIVERKTRPEKRRLLKHSLKCIYNKYE